MKTIPNISHKENFLDYFTMHFHQRQTSNDTQSQSVKHWHREEHILYNTTNETSPHTNCANHIQLFLDVVL